MSQSAYFHCRSLRVCLLGILAVVGLILLYSPSSLILQAGHQTETHLPALHPVIPACLVPWRRRDAAAIQSLLASTVPSVLHPSSCPQVITSLEWYSAFHQPHFMDHFSLFISILLWQSEFNGNTSCARYFGVLDSISEFWSDMRRQRSTWPIQMISQLKPSLGDFVISHEHATQLHLSLIDNNRSNIPGWFLHGSDAIWLTSTLLGRNDPCELYKRLMKSSHTTVTILQRRDARVMMNSEEVRQVIKSNVMNAVVAETYFDSMPLLQQVEVMLRSDIVVTIHGAGQTNIAFMKPCSVGKLKNCFNHIVFL